MNEKTYCQSCDMDMSEYRILRVGPITHVEDPGGHDMIWNNESACPSCGKPLTVNPEDE